MQILLEDEKTWPPELLEFLAEAGDVFRNWELARTGKKFKQVSGLEYDKATYDLRDLLHSHSLRGYHCCRLTEAEIETIEVRGMQLPDPMFLKQRILELVATKQITGDIATKLINNNQAADKNREGILCFCFSSPRRAGQRGIERFFRSWGGEALYNSHEDDPETGPVLANIGIPCIIEAEVPISWLGRSSFLTDKVARRYLKRRGFRTIECIDAQGYVVNPLPAQLIAGIIRHPSWEFYRLTDCSKWKPQL